MISTELTKANFLNPLARFVTKEAIAQLLKVKLEKIREIRCWRYVIHVVGVGISRFVSYGDIPPILGVEAPTSEDCMRWRKRWRKTQQQAPAFWVDFYEGKFRECDRLEELFNWGKLVGKIKHGLLQSQVEWLRNIYGVVKQCIEAVGSGGMGECDRLIKST